MNLINDIINQIVIGVLELRIGNMKSFIYLLLSFSKTAFNDSTARILICINFSIDFANGNNFPTNNITNY